MVIGNLPEGWEWKTLGEISEPPQYGWTTSASSVGNLRLLRTTDITSGVIDWDTVPFCAEEPDKKEKYLLNDGDIVISRAGSVGFSHLVKNPQPAVFASYLIRFRPLINEKYVAYFLQSPDYWQAISEQKLGIAIPNVNATKLKQINVPIPPLPEQERIVSRIEELFSDLEAGVAALERVRAGMRRYKASVLKAAVEGKLLENRGVESSGQLPEGWRWATLEELSSDANYGTSQKCDYTENEFPVVRIPNIISGNIDLSDLKFAIDGSGLREKDSLAPGDLLIIRTNGSRDLIGKSALIRRPLEKQLYFASYLIRYRIADYENVGAWISTIWDSPFIRAWLETMVSTTAGQYNLNIAKLNKLPIPLPPLEEQRRIVAEVERRLSVARQVESAVEAGLVRAARLRQSVLRSAFEGKL